MSRYNSLPEALDTVLDPELDEPVTDLGFVASSTVDAAGVAHVRLRLPTYFCAPNFAFLMVADAYEAVSAVAGVRQVDVQLIDHLAAQTINEGIAARAGFADSFGPYAEGELDELRATFVRKSVLAGTDRVCRPLLAEGVTRQELADMTLGSAPDSADLRRLRSRRAEIGLPADDADALLIDTTTGGRLGAEAVALHLQWARTTRVGIEANAGICRGQLAHRYGIEDAETAAGQRATPEPASR